MVLRPWPTGVVVIAVAVAAFTVGYHSRTATTVTSTTKAPAVTTTVTADQTWVATWPPPSSSLRFTNPTAAALSFATSVLRMTTPVARAFQRGDSRSGEVPIVTTTNGPLTTVLVRRLAPDDTWWVLGSSCSTVTITQPSALEKVSSPLTLSGQSTAFEGVINFSLYQDDARAPLVAGTTMGGSNGVVGKYRATLRFATPAKHFGTLVVYSRSAKDGSVLDASAIRVAF